MTDPKVLGVNLGFIGVDFGGLVDGNQFGAVVDWRRRLTVQDAASKLGVSPLSFVVWGE